MLEPVEPLFILIALLQGFDVFLGGFKIFDVCDLAYFELRKFLIQELLFCFEFADLLMGPDMSILHHLEFFCKLFGQGAVLFYKSILKVT